MTGRSAWSLRAWQTWWWFKDALRNAGRVRRHACRYALVFVQFMEHSNLVVLSHPAVHRRRSFRAIQDRQVVLSRQECSTLKAHLLSSDFEYNCTWALLEADRAEHHHRCAQRTVTAITTALLSHQGDIGLLHVRRSASQLHLNVCRSRLQLAHSIDESFCSHARTSQN